MTFEELLEATERLVKLSRDNFTKGHTDAAKCDLLTAVRKITDTLLDPTNQAAPSPGKMQW